MPHLELLVLFPFLSVPALAQASGEAPIDARFAVPGGLEVTLWAESPQLFNPTAMDVDARGRVWVTEAVNYRKWGGRNAGREHPGGDRVVILEDTDGDGRCDSSKVFAQSTDLVAPLGIAVLGDKVYVSCSPNLFVYTDADGDDVPDSRETLLTGFGGFDHDHGLHSVVFAPDGRLVFNAGNAGPHVVTDRAGWTLRSGSFYNGGGPETADNKPGLVSDDGWAWTGGLVLAMEEDGTGLEVLAHNFRNNYEVALDALGNLYTSDNDDDGNQCCRFLVCMEGGNHGYVSEDGTRGWTFDRRPGQDTETAHWHQDDPGVVPAGTITGTGGPTGVAVYEAELLAGTLRGAMLAADAGANVVYAFRPVANGAGFDLVPSNLIEPREGTDAERGRWFRPSDVTVALDGTVLVADWYDPGVGGHLAGDREAYGRILRIAPVGYRTVERRPSRPVDATPLRRAARELASPVGSVRHRAWHALLDGGEDSIPPLVALRGEIGAWPRAMFALARLSALEPLYAELRSPDPDFRIAAWRALRSVGAATLDVAEVLARDPSPAVRREVALAMRDVPLADSFEILVDLATRYDGADRAYLEAFGLGATGKQAPLYDELAARLGDVPAQWDARFEGLAWRLHPEASVAAFQARAMDPGLSADARRRAVDAIAFVPTHYASTVMIAIALTGPEDVRALARFWLEHRDTNTWRAYRVLDDLPPSGLEHADLVFASGHVRAGAIEIDVALGRAERVWLVVTPGSNGNGHDWADWIEPRLLDDAGAELRLTETAWVDASAAWGEVRVGKNAAGGPLIVDGAPIAEGIGTHAHSEIAYDVPPGFTRLRARAGVDDGGTRQPGSTTEVEFRIYAERAPDRSRLTVLRHRMETSDLVEAREAARELAMDPEGGLLLVHLAEKGLLSQELIGATSEVIFRNENLAVRALASASFQRPGGKTLPPIAELLRLDGDAGRGREVYFGQRAGCHQCHTLQRGGGDGPVHPRGGDIGPDLTRIREKYGTPELLDAVLNPNAGIAFGYDTWVVEDVDGELYSGFMLADGEQVVIKDTRGVRHAIPADEIADFYKQPLSTMPEGVALGLAPTEIADLVAFLEDDPDAPPTFGEEVALFDGRSLDGWTAYLADPDARMEDVWSVRDGVLVCSGAPTGYLRTERDFTSFELTLEWRFDPEHGPGNSGVLLRLHGEDRIWPKSIEAQLHHRDAGDLWNIGAFDLSPDPARTSGRRTSRLSTSSENPIGEWNRYVITLDHGHLRVEVNGTLQNVAEWCAEVPGKIGLQSEGAAIEFRDIHLRPIVD